MRVFGSGSDDVPDVLPPVLAPVPHEERMRAVISVAATIHLDVAGIIGKLALVFVSQDECVARFKATSD